MIKYVYVFYSALIACLVLNTIPYVNVLSHTWTIISQFIMGISSLFSVFLIIFNAIGYYEEKDDLYSTYCQFYLRYCVGLKFISKIPVLLWFITCLYFIQVNQLIYALSTFFVSSVALSVVLVQNSLYQKFLENSAKGN